MAAETPMLSPAALDEMFNIIMARQLKSTSPESASEYPSAPSSDLSAPQPSLGSIGYQYHSSHQRLTPSLVMKNESAAAIGSNISQPFLQYFGLSRQFEQDQSNFLCPCIVPAVNSMRLPFDLTSAISQNRPTSCLACHAFSTTNYQPFLDPMARATPSAFMNISSPESVLSSKHHSHGSELQKTGLQHPAKTNKARMSNPSAQSIVHPKRHPVPRKEPRSKSGRVDRREYRKEAERSRRDLMKCNFDMLKELLNMPKRLVSRDYILDCATEHILDLEAREKEKEEQVLFLERELVTIKNQLGL